MTLNWDPVTEVSGISLLICRHQWITADIRLALEKLAGNSWYHRYVSLNNKCNQRTDKKLFNNDENILYHSGLDDGTKFRYLIMLLDDELDIQIEGVFCPVKKGFNHLNDVHYQPWVTRPPSFSQSPFASWHQEKRAQQLMLHCHECTSIYIYHREKKHELCWTFISWQFDFIFLKYYRYTGIQYLVNQQRIYD